MKINHTKLQRWIVRMLALVVLGVAVPVPYAHAQDSHDGRLRWPELGLATAAAWDIGTTYRAFQDSLDHPELSAFHERNPLINPMERFGPRVMLPVGAAMEVGGWWLADRVWGGRHPQAMKWVKVAGMAAHVAAGVGNWRGTSRLRREQSR